MMRNAPPRVSWLWLALIGAVGVAMATAALAQIAPNNPQNQQNLGADVQIYQPVIPGRQALAPVSRLETIYSQRAGQMLTQFGYDILGVPTPVSAALVGAIQQNYVLGPGDEIVVSLMGQADAVYNQRINREGQLVLPRLGPIPAAGRTFDAFRADLEARVAQAFIATDVFVSLGQIRQISVLVTGEVRAPGTRIMSALASPLDALLLSGGIAKTGSLRNVAVIRGNQTQVIDLYGLLTQGTLASLGTLQNGDRVFVPPLQNTVAVAGQVRRSGIYELKDGEIGAETLIRLAGGFEIAGNYRLSKLLLEPTGATRLIPLAPGATIRDGEILFVDSSVDVALDRVQVQGAVAVPGAHPRVTAPTVARVIRNVDDLKPEAYTAFAVIARRDPRLNTRTLLPFSLARVLTGVEDLPLQNDDLIYVFTTAEVRLLANAATDVVAPLVQEALGPDLRDQTRLPIPVATPTTPANRPAAAVAADAGMPAAGANGGAADRQNQQPAARAAGAAGVAAQGTPRAAGQFGGLDAGGLALRIDAQGNLVAAGPDTLAGPEATIGNETTAAARQRRQAEPLARISEDLGVTREALVRSASDHVVWVLNQVRDPGAYLAAGGASLADMVQIAGGVLQQADLSFVEVTSTDADALAGTSRTTRTGYRGGIPDFQRVSLRRLDVVRLRSIFSERDQGQITVAGQVRYAGTFDITRGERLSSLLERAGGLTDQAYAYGAVFTRRSAAAAEREAHLRQARETESQLATLVTYTAQADPSAAGRAGFLQSLAQQISTAPVLGRIVVTADPALLRTRPELDILLEPGDTLFIPKRPSTVTVSGEVLNSGSFQYETGLRINDYLARAGGTTDGADRARIFLVLPDGSARPVQQSWLFNNANVIPPGSTIIVPRDLNPFNLQQFLRDAMQITSQLAITAASIVVLGR
jgi:polysaccharide export outer membrane protein